MSDSDTFSNWFLKPVAVVIVGGIVVWAMTGHGLEFGHTPATVQPPVGQVATDRVPDAGYTARPSYRLVVTSPPSPASPGTILYRADWATGMDGWTGSPEWKVAGGQLLNDGSSYSDQPSVFAPVSPANPDYAAEAQIQLVRLSDGGAMSGVDDFGLFIRAGQPGAYEAGICVSSGIYSCPGQNGHELFLSATGGNGALAARAYSADTKWHTLRLEVRGNSLSVLLDGYSLLTATDQRFLDPGSVGLWSNRVQVAVRSFVVTAL
jgi:hypothetical protein